MALGCSRDVYWYGDIFEPIDYFEADRERQKRQNENAWLSGMYVYDAICVALSNGFGKRHDAKYPEKPYDIVGLRKKEEPQANEALQAQLYMMQFAHKFSDDPKKR